MVQAHMLSSPKDYGRCSRRWRWRNGRYGRNWQRRGDDLAVPTLGGRVQMTSGAPRHPDGERKKAGADEAGPGASRNDQGERDEARADADQAFGPDVAPMGDWQALGVQPSLLMPRDASREHRRIDDRSEADDGRTDGCEHDHHHT